MYLDYTRLKTITPAFQTIFFYKRVWEMSCYCLHFGVYDGVVRLQMHNINFSENYKQPLQIFFLMTVKYLLIFQLIVQNIFIMISSNIEIFLGFKYGGLWYYQHWTRSFVISYNINIRQWRPTRKWRGMLMNILKIYINVF